MVHNKKYHAFGTHCSLSRRLELFLELGGAVGRKGKNMLQFFYLPKMFFITTGQYLDAASESESGPESGLIRKTVCNKKLILNC